MKSKKIDNEKKVIISVKDLYKTFKLPQEKHTSVKQIFVSMFKKKHYVEQKVLSDISFDVHEGDFFGIIGRNGSGKSTLLKILAGIYVPDSGSIEINGRISPFLELGVGFNPELSGYENVYLNGALLGLTKNEIRDKMDEIIEFSELKDFMDQKLKNYSSGMQVRLAFSVAIHAHAPIILLDEVMAVGDANFQSKCQKEFAKMKKEGRTTIFVTHDMESVKKHCNKVVLLSKGKIVASGSPEKATYNYLGLNLDKANGDRANSSDDEWGNKKVVIESVTMQAEGKRTNQVSSGSDMEILFKIANKTNVKKLANLSFGIYSESVRIFDDSTYFNNNNFYLKPEEKKIVKIKIPRIKLLDGNYSLSCLLFEKTPVDVYHGRKEVIYFSIFNGPKRLGLVDMDREWSFNEK